MRRSSGTQSPASSVTSNVSNEFSESMAPSTSSTVRWLRMNILGRNDGVPVANQ